MERRDAFVVFAARALGRAALALSMRLRLRDDFCINPPDDATSASHHPRPRQRCCTAGLIRGALSGYSNARFATEGQSYLLGISDLVDAVRSIPNWIKKFESCRVRQIATIQNKTTNDPSQMKYN
jgi:hypothetical protein